MCVCVCDIHITHIGMGERRIKKEHTTQHLFHVHFLAEESYQVHSQNMPVLSLCDTHTTFLLVGKKRNHQSYKFKQKCATSWQSPSLLEGTSHKICPFARLKLQHRPSSFRCSMVQENCPMKLLLIFTFTLEKNP